MWLWLSFSDPDRRIGKQFLGVAIVEVEADEDDDPQDVLSDAIQRAHYLKINPGGMIQSCVIDDIDTIPEDCRHRLLDRDELIERNIGESARV
jgi:hypothetical protein